MRWLKAFFLNPPTYVIWVFVVAIGLVAGYFTDPYVFAFTTFFMGGATIAFSIAGVGAILFARDLSMLARVIIAISLTLSGGLVMASLAMLRTFKWA